MNGAFSPERDVLYAADVTIKMYQRWFNTPAWPDKNGASNKIWIWMHADMANATQSDRVIEIGDGDEDYYPFSSLDIVAHEISHGFTAAPQHSKLIYNGQSGGLNESFSDMSAKAVEYFVTGKNRHWNYNDRSKNPAKWERYMDDPSKDCSPGQEPGSHCSIDNFSPYKNSIDVHYSSGIFNKAFYLIATSPEWNTKKAFEVMVQANRNYWTSTTTFCEAAHGVIEAANDYHYDNATLNKAFLQVGINVQDGL